MADVPENLKEALRKAAEAHADDILSRREMERNMRAEALAKRSRSIILKTELKTATLAESVTAPVQASAQLQTAGYLLAVGDSWFDYPLHDVLTKLDDHYGYNIEPSAHKGDPLEAMVSHVGQLDKFARCLDKIIALGATPKAILLSGGGDDVAGAEFGMLINNVDLPSPGWNEEVIAGVIDVRIANAFRQMFLSLNAICQKRLQRTFPILTHGYDYPVPDGRGFLGGWGPLPGPWLKPGFDEKLFGDPVANTQMMVVLIDRFNTMLQKVASEAGFENVNYINLRGILSNAAANYTDWWANELHPTGDTLFGHQDGFLAVATKFETELEKLP